MTENNNLPSINSIISKIENDILLTDIEVMVYADHINTVAFKETRIENKPLEEFESYRLYNLLENRKDDRNFSAVHPKVALTIVCICQNFTKI
jgi:hypothetical protein